MSANLLLTPDSTGTQRLVSAVLAWEDAIHARSEKRRERNALMKLWRFANGYDYYTPMTDDERDPTVEAAIAAATAANQAVKTTRTRLRTALRQYRRLNQTSAKLGESA